MVQTTARIVTLVTLVLLFSACSKKPAQISPTPEQAQAFAMLAPIAGAVNVTVTKIGSGSNVGYRVEVQPWKARPPVGHYFNVITWNFKGVDDSGLVDVKFKEVSLNFKDDNNFEDSADDPPYRLTINPEPPSSNLEIQGKVKNAAYKDKDYSYVINVEVHDGPRIEVDPDCRVWP
jgi:hypothetical protein